MSAVTRTQLMTLSKRKIIKLFFTGKQPYFCIVSVFLEADSGIANKN